MTLRRDHLRNVRRARGLTALAVAEAVGIREDAVYATERGRRRPTRDEAIAWALAIRMSPEACFPEVFTGEEGGCHE